MGIRIEEIHTISLGPLEKFSEVLGDINLIYGLNEQGKTFLVEFLLKSLFKDLKDFNLRSGEPGGNVLVSGLGDKQETFSPKNRRKLEDYWEKDFQGMPPKIARLLVVKGAELDLENTRTHSVSKTIIKSFLSSENKLDFIQNKIQKTIQEAKIDTGVIIGESRGELKTRNELKDMLETLDNLLDKVDQVFSGGDRATLKLRIEQLESEKESLRRAKRHKAYLIANCLAKIINRLEQLNKHGLDQLVDDYDEWGRLNKELEQKREKQNIAQVNSQHFNWLNNAIQEYEKLFERGDFLANQKFLWLAVVMIVFSGLLFIVGIVLSWVTQPLISTVLALLGFGGMGLGVLSGFLYIRQYKKSQTTSMESEEIKRISKSFEVYFGYPMRDLATLKTQKEKIEEDYFKVQSLQKDIEEHKNEIKRHADSITAAMIRFEYPETDESEWPEGIAALSKECEDLRTEKNQADLDLARLSIKEDDYLEADTEIEYDYLELESVEEQLQDTEEELRKEEEKLELLKTEIQSTIGDKTSTTWDDLLKNFQQRRKEIGQEYRDVTTRILAGILVNKVVKDSRQQEDEKIKESLSSKIVAEPLFNITGRYKSYRLEDDIITVSDRFNYYKIDELSTGAREQVLLALRLGFASKIMSNNTAFLILDDAFQHSDWERRQRLVDQTFILAKNGWQILYFSMDKHIQGIFEEAGKKLKSYKSFDITNRHSEF